MATIKSYTDIEQSKKLAKILPLESADICYQYQRDRWVGEPDYKEYPQFEIVSDKRDIPCWSLQALLDEIPDEIMNEQEEDLKLHIDKEDYSYGLFYEKNTGEMFEIETDYHDNFVDTCVEMITKLHELKML